uniref:Ribonuclease P/MRP protein subunit POP5 n=1 Tax=Pavo cristatus TaxID=9049 RepID=A0A8C9FBK1_PAVCR
MVRFKNRYVLCEVLSEDPRCRQCIEDRAVGLAVRDAIARAHGDYGLGCCCVSFTVKYLNAYTGTVLLRCRKDFQRLLSSALPLVRHLEGRGQRFPCALRTLHVGGTIRTCQKFLIQYNRRQLLLLLQNCTNEGEFLQPCSSARGAAAQLLLSFGRGEAQKLDYNSVGDNKQHIMVRHSSSYSCSMA